MVIMELCEFCNPEGISTGKCHICNNELNKLPEMEKKAEVLLKGCKNFSISTLIPKAWLEHEEDIFDFGMDGQESIKSRINNHLSKILAKKTGCRYARDGECKLIFEMRTGNVNLEYNELFVFGRYKKLEAGISQSIWLCKKCSGRGCIKCDGKGRNYLSIEEIIGKPMKEAADASKFTLHASGREDVDATNSAGRPFVIELSKAKNREIDLNAVKDSINKSGKVSVHDLRIVPREFSEIVTESHFDKEYEAEVEFDKDMTENDFKKIDVLQGAILEQRTPARVAHRRADLVRKRKIIELESFVNLHNQRCGTFRILAEAGTYIKELISGDNGRTQPSIAGVLGFGAKCTKLNVSKIYDCFLDDCK